MSTVGLVQRVRKILRDMGETFYSQVAGDGVTASFELPEDTVDPSTISAQLIPASGGAPTPLAQGTDYTIDPYNGLVNLTTPPPLGQILQVSGTYYEYGDDAEITQYLNDALSQHTLGRNPQVYLDVVPGEIPPTNVLPYVEERALALLTAAMIVQDEATRAAKNITIDTGNGTVIPRGQRYTQLTQEASRLFEEYQSLVEKLGVQGAYTVQVSNLRRVSMTTNRLVPEYMSREWDNRGFIQRVLPPVDTGIGAQGMVVTYRGQYSDTAVYYQNDEVDDEGGRYLCVATVPTGIQGIDPVNDVAAGPDGLHGANWQITTINSASAGFIGGW